MGGAKSQDGFVPKRVGPVNGFHRRQSQAGMIHAAAPSICQQCNSLVARDQIWEQWCLSCVVNWGHPDDAKDAIATLLGAGWSAASYREVIDRSPVVVSPLMNAMQAFGDLDLSTDAKHGVGRVAIEHGSETAGDGFLYNGEGRNGRMPREVHDHFLVAVKKLHDAGFSIRAISRITGVHRITIRTWRDGWEPKPCPCGREATHNGFCHPRFLASTRRQDFMRRCWHRGKTWPYQPRDGFQVAWGEFSG